MRSGSFQEDNIFEMEWNRELVSELVFRCKTFWNCVSYWTWPRPLLIADTRPCPVLSLLISTHLQYTELRYHNTFRWGSHRGLPLFTTCRYPVLLSLYCPSQTWFTVNVYPGGWRGWLKLECWHAGLQHYRLRKSAWLVLLGNIIIAQQVFRNTVWSD